LSNNFVRPESSFTAYDTDDSLHRLKRFQFNFFSLENVFSEGVGQFFLTNGTADYKSCCFQ